MRALLRQALSRFHCGALFFQFWMCAVRLDPQVCLCDPGPTNQPNVRFLVQRRKVERSSRDVGQCIRLGLVPVSIRTGSVSSCEGLREGRSRVRTCNEEMVGRKGHSSHDPAQFQQQRAPHVDCWTRSVCAMQQTVVLCGGFRELAC